jgi:hypothetical protein
MSRKRNLTEAELRAFGDEWATGRSWRQTQPFGAPPAGANYLAEPSPYQRSALARGTLGMFGNVPTPIPQAVATAQAQTPQASTNEETIEDTGVVPQTAEEVAFTDANIPTMNIPPQEEEEYDTLTGNLFGSGVSGRRRMNARRRMFY